MTKRIHIKAPVYLIAALALQISQTGSPGSIAAAAECPSDSVKSDKRDEYPFIATNRLFLKNYSAAKKELRQNLGPVIICTGDSLSLHKEGSVERHKFIGYKYTTLKQIAHITLGTYVILINHCGSELPAETRSTLESFGEAIRKAASQIETLDLSDKEKQNQKEICEKTIAFIDRTLKEGELTRNELRNYTRSVAALTLDNAYGAVGEQLSTIDGIVRKWLEQMPEEDREKLHVIIETGHMPREKQSSLQYFLFLLKEKRPGRRVITMESMKNEEEGINLLLTHILDEKVAVDFYADSWRMHRDLLSDGATKYLKKDIRRFNKTK